MDIRITYRAKTSVVRRERATIKSHTNDAYCLGKFFQKHRAAEETFRKARRNSRILQKFYNAIYINSRTREEAKSQELTNGRISRNHKKDHENLHPFRSRKVSKGRVTVRRSRTTLKPGSRVEFDGKILTVYGTHTSRYGLKKQGRWPVASMWSLNNRPGMVGRAQRLADAGSSGRHTTLDGKRSLLSLRNSIT